MVKTQLLVKKNILIDFDCFFNLTVTGMRSIMKLSAVFFDRDGTVIFDKHYLKDPS